MAKLLQTAREWGIETIHISKLLSAFKPPVESLETGLAASKFSGEILIGPPSERKIQVLRLLESTLTRVEISRE